MPRTHPQTDRYKDREFNYRGHSYPLWIVGVNKPIFQWHIKPSYYIEKCEIFDEVSLCVLQYVSYFAGEAGKSILAEVTLNNSWRSGGIFTGKCHISYLGKKNTLKLVVDVFYHISIYFHLEIFDLNLYFKWPLDIHQDLSSSFNTIDRQ